MAIVVTIEREECIMCGACYATCPEVFEESLEDSLSQIVEEYRAGGDVAKGEVPEDLEDCVQEAVADCPVEIIKVGGE